MNPHELRFQRTGRTLCILIGLWVGAMAVAWALAELAPHSKSDAAYLIFELLFSTLFVAILIVSVLRMVAYIRWTGRYPYYFFFKRSGTSTDRGAMKRHSSAHGRTFWTTLIVAANIVHVWLFLRLPNAHPAQFWITIAIHTIACIGPFWMLWHWFVRRGKKVAWQRWMWLFFVPWGFLWYVFEKYEPVQSELLTTGR